MNESSSSSGFSNIHFRLSDLGSIFRQTQIELLQQPGPEQRDQLQKTANDLIDLCDDGIEQVLGELFLAEHANYNFTKPLYIAASLVELIRRLCEYDPSVEFDAEKRQSMVIAALGYNLGLLAHEQQVYEKQDEFSLAEKQRLREDYPGQSADILKIAGFDQPLIQDMVRNHNLASENPSDDALLLRTPFIYAGIAIPQNIDQIKTSITNPSREFAQMFADKELDLVYGGLFLKINGMAPIGSILKLESNERALVLSGPQAQEITSSKVRLLANRNGVQLIRPGEIYTLNDTPTRLRGLADHHHFAWTNFSPYEMWGE